MKRVLIAMICLASVLAISVNAEDAPKKPTKLTEEQKAVRKAIVAKYDTNGDKKLDKEERAKISSEDKAKLEKAGLNKKHGKAPKK
jgi:hypothetical protein